MAWTEHVSENGVQTIDPAGGFGPSIVPEIKPGRVGVWITAVLSLSYFSYHSYDGFKREYTGFVVPLGFLFTFWCWRLVTRARREYEAQGLALPQSYQAALIVAVAFGVLSTSLALIAMLA
jgi:hypothetical protein